MKKLKYAIVWSLVKTCSVLDHFPFYSFKHREFSKNQLGCYIGLSRWSAQLDDHWETEVWKPIV